MPTQTDTERLDALDGTALIAAERRRQVEQEGYTAEHDDEHDDSELLLAAKCYIEHAFGRGWIIFNNPRPDLGDGLSRYQSECAPDDWPWSEDAWNPHDPIRDIARAGALIAAEIDRLKRRQAIDQSLLAKEGE
jgi:hypothetical protein